MTHVTPFFKQCQLCNTIVYYKTFAILQTSLQTNRKCKKCHQKENGAYSKEEESFLRDNYAILGARKCSEKLNRSTSSIYVKVDKMKLERHILGDNINNKRCGRCRIEQPKTNFGKSKCRKDGLHPLCKKCLRADRELPSNKKKKYEYDAVYRVFKEKTDIIYKIKRRLRRRVKDYLKRKDRLTTIELLGCSIEQCIRHLESLFTEGMSWENYGFKGWHIDHIIPCASFNLLDPEEQKKCFNYKNLQPLWWWDNLSKEAKHS
jgi:hypothetical protein